MHRFLHRCLTRTPILGVLMAALVFRALVPTGVMAAPAADGSIVMQLCSGFVVRTVVVEFGEPAESTPDGSLSSAHSPCGFAVAALGLPPADASDSMPAPAAIGLPATSHGDAPLPTVHVAHSPRGPPVRTA